MVHEEVVDRRREGDGREGRLRADMRAPRDAAAEVARQDDLTGVAESMRAPCELRRRGLCDRRLVERAAPVPADEDGRAHVAACTAGPERFLGRGEDARVRGARSNEEVRHGVQQDRCGQREPQSVPRGLRRRRRQRAAGQHHAVDVPHLRVDRLDADRSPRIPGEHACQRERSRRGPVSAPSEILRRGPPLSRLERRRARSRCGNTRGARRPSGARAASCPARRSPPSRRCGSARGRRRR
jgi:hypothetical protein